MTAGVPTLYLGEYLYRTNTPNLPPEMSFTEIPMLWPLLVFLAVEGLTLLCGAYGFSRGQKKRKKERNALTGETNPKKTRSAEKTERFLYNDDSAPVLPVISAEYHSAGLAAHRNVVATRHPEGARRASRSFAEGTEWMEQNRR